MSPAQTMMPFGSSGGKGGSMGGFNFDNQGTGLADYSGGGGKGGSAPSDPVAQTPAAPAPVAPAPEVMPAAPAENAFTQGVGAQDKAMDFFSGAVDGGASHIMDMISKMSQGAGSHSLGGGGGGGGSYGPAYQAQGVARDLYDYDPAQVNAQGYSAAQLSDADLSQYMNPYTQDVIDTTMADLGRARDSAMNASGVAATRGGAFGGDRHAVMESLNNADYMRQAASTSAQLRNQGFQNAQNAAMADINSLNQSRAYNAQEQMAAGMANAQAANDRSQFVGSTAAQAEMEKERINAQMAAQAQAASASGAAGAANRAYQMAQMKQADQHAALQAAMQMYGMQYDAANQLYNMGGDRYDMGQEATANLANVGNQVDQINQGLINQIQDMFMTQQNAPQAQYQQMLAAMSGQPNWGGTQTYNPGFFDYASLGAGVAGSWLGGKG